MVFQEKKKEQGFEYKVEDVFGSIKIESPEKLAGDVLDDIVLILLRTKLSAQEISGEAEISKGKKVKYNFVRANQWEDDEDEDEVCSNTHTETKKQETEEVPTTLSYSLCQRIGNWCKKFVVAFREAWKNQQ